MPRCPGCDGSMTIEEMQELQGTFLCPRCWGRFRRLLERAAQEEAMDKNELFTLSVSKVGGEEEQDYEIKAAANTGALELKFCTTIGEIRKFFTERRDKSED